MNRDESSTSHYERLAPGVGIASNERVLDGSLALGLQQARGENVGHQPLIEHFVDQDAAIKEMVLVGMPNVGFVILVPIDDFLTRGFGFTARRIRSPRRK